MILLRSLFRSAIKKFLLAALLLQLAILPCHGAGPDDFAAREIFYNVLSIVQNSYIYPTDNWILINGAIKGLQKKFGEDLLTKQGDDNNANISYRGVGPVELKKEEVTDNAFVLMEYLSKLFLLLSENIESPDNTAIIYAAIDGMIKTLDPHSSFIDPQDFQDMQARNVGIFKGIGIEITMKDDVLTIVSPFEGTPAFKMGLKANDRIIKIDNVPTAGMDIIDAIVKLRGPKGSRVTVSIMRAGWNETKDITIVRDVLPLHSVKHKILEPGFASIKITSFLSKTTEDLRSALSVLTETEDLKGLILDLRNNPGGLLDQAIDICDIFLDRGVIVTTKGRDRQLNRTFNARPGYEHYEFPIILLVNEGSASGTEIVAASLQENRKSLVIGTQTFGKGSIQTVFAIKDGAALRLTTAKFYTPLGNEIQEIGIFPDIQADDQEEHDFKREVDLKSSIKVSQSHVKENMPTMTFSKNKKKQKDPVLAFALEILKRTPSNKHSELLKTAKKIISEN